MELMKKPEEDIPGSIPGAIRIMCPYCKKKFHTHLFYGTVVTWCKRCRRLIKTSREEVSAAALLNLSQALILLLHFYGVGQLMTNCCDLLPSITI